MREETRERETERERERESEGASERPDLSVEALVIFLLGLANAEDRLQPLSNYV